MPILLAMNLFAVSACDGDGSGSTPAANLLRVDSEAAGTNCATGGVAINSGMDVDSDGELDDVEVLATNYVCNGAVGSVGPKGDAGDKGDTGATGTIGSKGDQGDQGPQGDQGAQGVPGDQGPAGPGVRWVDAAGVELVGVISSPRWDMSDNVTYMDSIGHTWILVIATGVFTPWVPGLQRYYESNDCTGTEYWGRGQLVAPRATYNVQGVAGSYVNADDELGHTKPICSNRNGLDVCRTFSPCDPREGLVLSTDAIPVTVPTVTITPPVHLEYSR